MSKESKSKRDIFTLLKLPVKQRTTKEKKRVKEFLKKQAQIKAMPHQPCKVCGKEIPKPLDCCSSECRRIDNEKARQDESKRTKET